ncbi:MerR family transcriptional regulator [Kineosporia succinea]|uniref:DNA-binding transcriptional MerR regulator n=1 Tax=Kineosporia succinea TaxID=84632 RepID=A0ABT9PBY8_9ACTN|nr:MerR family transcriptional regulator [Kineosporia succinea]MDP9830224.1 DNA-binding transcriptional MerR regulator [Kineosporia succinea]
MSARTGVSARSLRYYEEQGLLASERSSSGQRLYGDEAVGRVRWIQLLFGAGLSSQDIVKLLPCVHSGVADPEMFGVLAEQRARMDAQVKDLTATLEKLDAVMLFAATIVTEGQPA